MNTVSTVKRILLYFTHDGLIGITPHIMNFYMERNHMDFGTCFLQPLTEKTALEISQWEYEEPYRVYSFKGHHNGYLFDSKAWGTEQFALCQGEKIIGQVACQFDSGRLWCGWSLAPEYCGKGNGHLFVNQCVQEIRKVKQYRNKIYLRVAVSNKRAVRAYQKAGFVYSETILDEIAYSGHMEDFWIMVKE
ncbi:MAG: GNAT family N-acetyltransferase [Oscillospiraceae bacterium]|nr:GNAT family N-acetyltransferase [Oscillospiraceae bacterium]